MYACLWADFTDSFVDSLHSWKIGASKERDIYCIYLLCIFGPQKQV